MKKEYGEVVFLHLNGDEITIYEGNDKNLDGLESLDVRDVEYTELKKIIRQMKKIESARIVSNSGSRIIKINGIKNEEDFRRLGINPETSTLNVEFKDETVLNVSPINIQMIKNLNFITKKQQKSQKSKKIRRITAGVIVLAGLATGGFLGGKYVLDKSGSKKNNGSTINTPEFQDALDREEFDVSDPEVMEELIEKFEDDAADIGLRNLDEKTIEALINLYNLNYEYFSQIPNGEGKDVFLQAIQLNSDIQENNRGRVSNFFYISDFMGYDRTQRETILKYENIARNYYATRDYETYAKKVLLFINIENEEMDTFPYYSKTFITLILAQPFEMITQYHSGATISYDNPALGAAYGPNDYTTVDDIRNDILNKYDLYRNQFEVSIDADCQNKGGY